MPSLHSNRAIPAKVDAFSLKVRVMIDRRDCGTTAKKLQSNVIPFPSSIKRLEQQKTSLIYLEACQQLLNPVRHFFYEVDGRYTLDVYLGELNAIAGQYFNGDELHSEGHQELQADVVNLQVAGFEHTTELMPQVIATHGDRLATQYLGIHYVELAQTHDIAPLLKAAYADVKGMIKQAKLMMNPSERPTLRQR